MDFDADTNPAKNPENLRTFEYHCAHSYWAYAEITRAIFCAPGEVLNETVLSDFEADYEKKWQISSEATAILISMSADNLSAARKEIIAVPTFRSIPPQS